MREIEMSEQDGDSFLEWRVPVWQLLFGLAAAFTVKYFVDSKKHKSHHHNKHRSQDDVKTPSSPALVKQDKIESHESITQEKKPLDESEHNNTTKESVKKEDTKVESDEESDDGPYDPDYLFYDDPYPIEDNYTFANAPFKMVLVVNNQLKMGKGKIAAQCGHATLGAYKLSKKFCRSALQVWERFGVAKIALKVEEEQEMYDLLATAKSLGIVAYIVEDAGRTQIAAGSRTVLALGPAPAALLDQITGHLKLL